MKTTLVRLKTFPKIVLLAVILILIGVAVMIPKGIGMFHVYQEVEFARQHDFGAGNPSADLLRPWMTIRYIAVAYSVPQQYLFDALDVTPRRESSMLSLSRLNQQLKLGSMDGKPATLNTVREAILAYQANPVVTGLMEQHVEDWMSVQYIANSTGIPAETIFAGIGLPTEDNAYLAIGFLSQENHYPGGAKKLTEAIQRVIDAKEQP